jgi:FtsZ-interacting cell division protein ZipA
LDGNLIPCELPADAARHIETAARASRTCREQHDFTACSFVLGAAKANTEFSPETQMKYVLLAVLAAFSLSVMAGKPTKEQKTSEQATQGADTCDMSIDQPGVKRQQKGAQPQQECRTFNESRSNSSREAGKAKEGATVQKAGGAGIATSDPGVPTDKATAAKK